MPSKKESPEDKFLKKWEESIHNETASIKSDRSYVIIMTSYLDDLLKRILTLWFVKDSKVKNLFTNDHILQSFYSKSHIAYYSGLIPKFVLKDLNKVGQIRNKFAHTVDATLSLDHESIKPLINELKLAFHSTPDSFVATWYRMKFLMAITQQSAILEVIGESLKVTKIPRFTDILDLNKMQYQDTRLSEAEITNIIQKNVKQQ